MAAEYFLIAALDVAVLVIAVWAHLSGIGTVAALLSAHLAARMLIR